ncbi:MAG: hypothetical protein AAGI92_12890, partial [Pseudomonadota bacterium]
MDVEVRVLFWAPTTFGRAKCGKAADDCEAHVESAPEAVIHEMRRLRLRLLANACNTEATSYRNS